VCHGWSCIAALSPTHLASRPSSASAASPGSQQLLSHLRKGAPAVARSPRDVTRREGIAALGADGSARRRESLSPGFLRETKFRTCPSQGAGGRHIGAAFSCTSNPTLIDRDTTAAPEWIEMACRLEHRTVVEVGRDSIEDVDAGIVRVEPERPERFMAATSARVGSTSSSSTTPTTRGLRRPARRHSATPRTASTLGAVTAPATLRATSEDSGRQRRRGGGRAPARGRSMSLTGPRHRMLDQSVARSRHATRPGCAASKPRGARHAQTYP
jgi:hypothetical protein